MFSRPNEIVTTPAGRYEIVVHAYGGRKARFYAVVYELLPAAGRFSTVIRRSAYSGLDGMGSGLASTAELALANGRAYVDGMVA